MVGAFQVSHQTQRRARLPLSPSLFPFFLLLCETSFVAKSDTKEMQRLDKCVAHLTGLSRQGATKLIKEGAVTVAGVVITDAKTKVSLSMPLVIAGFSSDSEDSPEAQGERMVTAADAFKKRVYILNKPYGYVCSSRDKNHSVVSSLWRQELHPERLQAVGRLDVDTTGLLLVTDDGALNHELTSPKKNVAKLYVARLDRPVPESAVAAFAAGIKHPEESQRYQSAKLLILPENAAPATEQVLAPAAAAASPAEIASTESSPTYWAAVTVYEGRFHEVKRLFEVVGCEVLELVRVALGALTLPATLFLGQMQLLSKEQWRRALESHDFTTDEVVALITAYQDSLQSSAPMYLPPAWMQLVLGVGATAATAATAAAASEVDAEDAADDAEDDVQQDASLTDIDEQDDLVDADEADDAADAADAEADFDELDEDGELRIY